MVHSSELSWTRISHPSDVVFTVRRLPVTVKSFDMTQDASSDIRPRRPTRGMIFMSTYTIGDVARSVVSLLPFGAFR